MSEAHVSVSTPPVPPTNNDNKEVKPVRARFTLDPASIRKGQTVMLRWSSQNATDLDLEPGVGRVSAQGSKPITPQESTTYTLIATGPGGTQHVSAHVDVTNPPPPPPPPPPNDKVKAKLTLGNWHLGRGEYDAAIASFEEGLRLDPKNVELNQALQKTVRACKTEVAAGTADAKCTE
jgi:tetratricopeptide (TPR) repeat protein